MIGLGVGQEWTVYFSQLATGGLIAAVWQGLLLAIVVGLVLRLLPKMPAAIRFAIWFAVFLVVTGLPVFSLWSHAAGSTQMGGRSAWLTLDVRWSIAIAALWGAASLVRAGTLVVAAIRVRTLWKRAKLVDFESAGSLGITHGEIAAMDGAPGILLATRRPQICTSNEVDRPTVIGFFSPKILIPEWLLKKLTAAELEQIVLHETGHLGRADDWMNLLQKVALVVFPLNPALAWVERRLCFERELACDERVLRATQAPKAYAACLATLAEHRLGRRGLVLALGALGRESELGQRVARILQRGETMRSVHAKLVLGGVMLGLLGGAVGLERCPQVVGFAPNTEHKLMAAAPRHVARALAYEPVLLRESTSSSAIANNQLGNKPNVSHETLLTASVESGASANPNQMGLQRLKSKVESMNRIDARKSEVARMRSTDLMLDRQSGQTANGEVEWVVMTSWQRMDGSPMILTVTSSSTSRERLGPSRVVSDLEPSSSQIYPYAAVPVRGGWLLFQM